MEMLCLLFRPCSRIERTSELTFELIDIGTGTFEEVDKRDNKSVIASKCGLDDGIDSNKMLNPTITVASSKLDSFRGLLSTSAFQLRQNLYRKISR